ncbi:MAG: FkbM family methyltransferase [Lacibacter sp.]
MKQLEQIFQFINKHPLAGKHKVKAYCRFFWWQFSQLFFPHETVVPFIGKTKLAAKKGLHGITGNIYTGLEDFNDMGFLLHFLRKEDLFADIGANAGSYSVLAAGCTGSRTIAFEPVPSTFSWLEKNIELNKLSNLVKAINIGLGSKREELFFTSNHGTVNHVVAENENGGDLLSTKVEVLPFDEISFTEGIPQLIKIDVEGFETEVLKGMNSTFQSQDLKAIIIELNGSGERYGYNEQTIHQNLLSLNFYPCRYDPFTRSLNQLEGFGSHNTIYIRDIDFARGRVQTADKFKIFSEAI